MGWTFQISKTEISTKKIGFSLIFSCPKIGRVKKTEKSNGSYTKLLSGALDGGVDGEGEDEEDEAVEDAQDGQTAVLWVVLWAWKYQIWIYSSVQIQILCVLKTGNVFMTNTI